MSTPPSLVFFHNGRARVKCYTFVVTTSTVNTRTNPIQIAAWYSSSHTISSGGEHWFSFQGTGETAVFETTGNVVDTYIEVYAGSSTSGTYALVMR